MGKHNYNAQYNKFQGARSESPVMDETAEIAEETVEEVVEDTVEEVADEAVEVETETSDKTVGVVDNCDKLNVRRNPTLSATPLAVINKGDEVQIDTANSTDEWYKICTANGVEGYCMKKFITIK